VTARPKRLVLAVIDSLKPEMLERAVAEGRAPVLATLLERGVYVPDCVSTFPSVTPVASGSIATGLGPDEHHIPSMNWYHRGEERYVEYGSSLQASRAFGWVRSLYDTVYNLNMAHLNRAAQTLFERLDDDGVRTACTTYLVYRGRTRHELTDEGVYSRLARFAQFRHAVWGPSELFYADLFASRKTGCRSILGMPGQRDQYAGCVGAHLVENELFDFLLLSLPDNDFHSHKHGPYRQAAAIAGADRALERLMHVAGGPDAFLEDHAVIVMSDHSQTAVEERLDLSGALGGWRVLAPSDPAPERAEIAVCPAQRAAMVYVLEAERRERLAPELARHLQGVAGVDLVARIADGEGVASSTRGEVRFAPGGELSDLRGERWAVEGDLEVLGLDVADGVLSSRAYPDALARLWSALRCPAAGEVLISAAPGQEFVDWGGTDHVGGGSHGSLHRGDSLGVLLFCGTGPTAPAARAQWSVTDAAQVVRGHFSLAS
jgi:Type I phosphodiesterase / nucleotide pyrophosphatase